MSTDKNQSNQERPQLPPPCKNCGGTGFKWKQSGLTTSPPDTCPVCGGSGEQR